jgi:hypothetical protein
VLIVVSTDIPAEICLHRAGSTTASACQRGYDSVEAMLQGACYQSMSLSQQRAMLRRQEEWLSVYDGGFHVSQSTLGKYHPRAGAYPLEEAKQELTYSFKPHRRNLCTDHDCVGHPLIDRPAGSVDHCVEINYLSLFRLQKWPVQLTAMYIWRTRMLQNLERTIATGAAYRIYFQKSDPVRSQ